MGELLSAAPHTVHEIAALDEMAVAIWDRQLANTSVSRPAEASSVEDVKRYEQFVAERRRLNIAFQRIRAAAAAVAFGKGFGASSGDLVRSHSVMYYDLKPSSSGAGPTAELVREIYSTDRQVLFGEQDDPASRYIGRIIDNRRDPKEPAAIGALISLRLYSTNNPDSHWTLHRRDGRSVFDGKALSVAKYDVPTEVLRAGGAVTVTSASQAENRYCDAFLYDYLTEFVKGSAGPVADIYVADAAVPTDRIPHVWYSVLALGLEDNGDKVETPQAGECKYVGAMPWVALDEDQGKLTPMPEQSRSGWHCTVNASSVAKARDGLFVVRVELPYPGCPTVDRTQWTQATPAKPMVIGQK